MLVIMVITVKSDVLTSLDYGRSDRGINLTYLVDLSVAMELMTELYSKRRLDVYYSSLTALFV